MGQLNPRDKERQRAIDDALQQRMSARFERRIRREIGQTFREAASAYEKRGDLAIPLALSDHSRGIAAAIQADYRTIGAFFGRRLLKEAKAYAPALIIKDGEDLEDALDMAIDRFARTWLATKVTQINSTTEHQLRRIITVGLAEGWGVDKIARTMREMAGPLSAVRAHVIARTETHTAANFGAQQAAELTGLQMRREWVSAADERTRDTDEADHVSANGQIVGMREPFEVSGESLMFPGDPSGSPENVIMCFTGDTPIAYHSIKHSIKSLYRGKLITIQTKRGHKLTGTPNHPILTDKGFIPLGQVDKSTNLVCCGINVNFANALDVNYVPSGFKEVHDSLSVHGVVMRMGSVGVNLYGRAPAGEVEVVSVNGELLDDLKTSSSYGVGKLLLKKPNFGAGVGLGNGVFLHNAIDSFRRAVSRCSMSLGDLMRSLFAGHLRPLERFGFALSSDVDTRFFEGSPNATTRNAEHLGNGVFTHARHVSGNSIAADAHVLPRVSGSVMASQAVVDVSLGYAEGLCNLSGGFSSHVHIDNVDFIDVSEVSHGVPVYTVETKEGIYNAGGIIASNCRCSIVFIYD